MKLSAILVASVLMAGPALAQEKSKKAGDPNRVICRTSDVIGSRLQTERKCMTAQQWTQLARDQRETTEKVQSQRFVISR